MTLLKQLAEVFNQADYNNTFYCCDKEHPFVAFVTCYCPLCELKEELVNCFLSTKELEDALDNLTEEHHALVIKAKKHSPELLI